MATQLNRRPSHRPVISDEEKRFLADLAYGKEASERIAQRARLVLEASLSNISIAKLAEEHGSTPTRVRRWLQRYAELGREGLADAPRPGAPRRIPDFVRESINDLHNTDQAFLSTRLIANKTDVSQSSVTRIIRENGRPSGKSRYQTTSLSDNFNIDKIVVQLFDSLAEEKPWLNFLDMLKTETGSDYGTLLTYADDRPKPSLIIMTEFSEMGVFSYQEKHYANELLVGLSEGKVQTLSDRMSIEEIKSTDFYQDYLKPYGVIHIMGVDIGTVRGVSCKLRLVRKEHKTDYGPKERRICEKIVPFLRTALNLFVKRIDIEAARAAFATTVSGMSVGSIMVDPDGLILEANEPAMATLNQRDGIFLSGNRLVTQDPKQAKHLRKLIRMNAEGSLTPIGSQLARALAVDRPSGRASLSLLVRPATGGQNGQLAIRPTALIHIVDPAQPRVTVINTLIQLFELTPAEAGVALSLSNGQTINEIAASKGISRNTVRSQMQSVFAKMGVSRQAELIRTTLISVGLLSLPS